MSFLLLGNKRASSTANQERALGLYISRRWYTGQLFQPCCQATLITDVAWALSCWYLAVHAKERPQSSAANLSQSLSLNIRNLPNCTHHKFNSISSPLYILHFHFQWAPAVLYFANNHRSWVMKRAINTGMTNVYCVALTFIFSYLPNVNTNQS